MPTLRLNAILGLNKTGFDAGMRDAQKNVQKFATSMTARIGSAILSAFGIQRLVRFGGEVLQQAVHIDTLAKKFSLTTDEVQLLQHEANRTGQSFDALVSDAEQLEQILSRLRGGEGVIFSTQQVSDLVDAHAKLKAFGDELAKLAAKGIENPGGFFKRALRFGNDAVRKRFGVEDPDEDEPNDFAARQDAFLEKKMAAARAKARVAEIAKETATLREQTQKRLLSDEEKLVELAAQRELIFQRITKTAVERATKEKDLAANELAIAQARDAVDRKATKTIETIAGARGSAIGENPLGRIGAFSGGSAESGLAAGQAQMLSTLRAMHLAMVAKGIIVRDVR